MFLPRNPFAVSSAALLVTVLTAAPAVLPTSPAAAQTRAARRLTDAERKALDVFFSNFAETRVAPFRRDRVSDDQLISFALRHDEVNAPGRFRPVRDGDTFTPWLSASRVDETARRYFGRPVRRHHSFEERLGNPVGYKDGGYTWPAHDGGPEPFAQVTSWRVLGKGLFEARVTEYQPSGIGWDGDRHAAPSSWKRAAGPNNNVPVLHRRMRAVVRRVSEAGKGPRYVLVEFVEAE